MILPSFFFAKFVIYSFYGIFCLTLSLASFCFSQSKKNILFISLCHMNLYVHNIVVNMKIYGSDIQHNQLGLHSQSTSPWVLYHSCRDCAFSPGQTSPSKPAKAKEKSMSFYGWHGSVYEWSMDGVAQYMKMTV